MKEGRKHGREDGSKYGRKKGRKKRGGTVPSNDEKLPSRPKYRGVELDLVV